SAFQLTTCRSIRSKRGSNRPTTSRPSLESTMGDPVADANAPLPNPQPPRLPKWEWLVPIGISVFLVIYGVQVIATKEASAGRGFRGGPARLTTTQAWFMGGAFFFGAGILPFGYLAAR